MIMKTSRFKMNMFRTVLAVLASAPFGLPAWSQQSAQSYPTPRYELKDLGTLSGGNFSQSTAVNDFGLITGLSTTGDGTFHATLSRGEEWLDISKNAPSGINSGAFAANIWGQVLVLSEIPVKDPNNEDFCAFGTGNVCRAFLWQEGKLFPLQSLGGPNSSVSWINNRGQAVGVAETTTRDPQCYPGISFTGTGPQVLDFEAVLWDLSSGRARELPPLPGDTVGITLGINDLGQVVGGSGSCANTFPPGPATSPHAVLWEGGKPLNMGNLGGSVDTDLPGVATLGLSINNHGVVTGVAALPGNATAHAFLWSKQLNHMVDLGTIPGDVRSAGLAINEEGDVVGPSFDAEGDPRAYLRLSRGNGSSLDLNALVPQDAPLYLLVAFDINDVGEIVGFGVDNNGDIHGFLAKPIPCEELANAANSALDAASQPEIPRAILSQEARELLRKRTRFGAFLGPGKSH
jgi:uncharacterized membrane protein